MICTPRLPLAYALMTQGEAESEDLAEAWGKRAGIAAYGGCNNRIRPPLFGYCSLFSTTTKAWRSSSCQPPSSPTCPKDLAVDPRGANRGFGSAGERAAIHPFSRQIVKFKMLAKATQPKYGTISRPAANDFDQKQMVVAKIAANNTTTSINAAPGKWKPKKSHDQAAFRTN